MGVATMNTLDQENIMYLKHFLGEENIEVFQRGQETTEGMNEEEKETCEEVKKILDLMQSYGENRWWDSNDGNVIGYYQLMCPYMLVHKNQYVDSVEFLLGRHVSLKEFEKNKEALRKEAAESFRNGGNKRKKNPHSTK